jgi:hypothetical protein
VIARRLVSALAKDPRLLDELAAACLAGVVAAAFGVVPDAGRAEVNGFAAAPEDVGDS